MEFYNKNIEDVFLHTETQIIHKENKNKIQHIIKSIVVKIPTEGTKETVLLPLDVPNKIFDIIEDNTIMAINKIYFFFSFIITYT